MVDKGVGGAGGTLILNGFSRGKRSTSLAGNILPFGGEGDYSITRVFLYPILMKRALFFNKYLSISMMVNFNFQQYTKASNSIMTMLFFW